MKKILISTILFSPSIVLGAETFKSLIYRIVDVINIFIPVVAGLILLVFFWGIFKYVYSQSDSANKGEGKSIIIWGLIAIFVVASMWGLINLVARIVL